VREISNVARLSEAIAASQSTFVMSLLYWLVMVEKKPPTQSKQPN
jgi:hypothetical protein